jgi:hypothetical protein
LTSTQEPRSAVTLYAYGGRLKSALEVADDKDDDLRPGEMTNEIRSLGGVETIE